MAITKDQIFNAADAIDAAGQSPTLVAVRKALGSGSYTTISEAMTEWKALRATKPVPIRETPPQAILDLLDGVGAEMWAAALALANGRLNSERDALEQARVQLEAGKNEAAELADQMSVELETLKSEREVHDAAVAKLRRAVEEREAVADSKAQALASATARLDEVTKRADQLNAELERVGAQNAELIAAVAKMTQAGRGQD